MRTPQEIDAEYFAHPGINNSSLKYALLNARAYQRYITSSVNQETRSMSFGSYFHFTLLFNEYFESNFRPKMMDGRTKAGKEEAAEAKEDGFTLIPIADWEKARIMKEEALSCELISDALDDPNVIIESPIYNEQFVSIGSIVSAKCKPDIICGDMMIDVKTTKDSSPHAFRYSCLKYGYFRQAAWYMDIAKSEGHHLRRFIFAACDTDTLTCQLYEISEESLSLGRMEYEDALANIIQYEIAYGDITSREWVNEEIKMI